MNMCVSQVLFAGHELQRHTVVGQVRWRRPVQGFVHGHRSLKPNMLAERAACVVHVALD